MKIYVVAWEYDGGAGFNWYKDQFEAEKAEKKEKENAIEFKDYNWTPFGFDINIDSGTPDEQITKEIDGFIWRNPIDLINGKEFVLPTNKQIILKALTSH